MTVIRMSDRELTRLRVMIDLVDGRLRPEAAGALMVLADVRYSGCAAPLRPLGLRD
jgi:hypothetical protein